jgi:hypothetical protein
MDCSIGPRILTERSGFRPPRKHITSQLQRSVGLCSEGTSEHGNEPSGSIKEGNFLSR